MLSSLVLSVYVKFSRTDKMYAFLTRIGAQIWNSIPYSIKILKRSSFRPFLSCGQRMIMSKSPVLLSYLIL